MASEMVERLAKKQAEHFDVKMSLTRFEDARWWLKAIADELERGIPMEHWSGWESAVGWLREQAGEE